MKRILLLLTLTLAGLVWPGSARGQIAVEVWVQRYNGLGNAGDHPTAVAVDTNGNVYLTGHSTGGGGNYDYNVLTTPTDHGTTKTVIVNPPSGNRFYRLRGP